jgi:hypothetical protein
LANDFKPFNPNRGDTSKGSVLLPQLPAEIRSSILNAEGYLAAMSNVVAGLGDIIDKAQAPVPQAYSYARISYMPDANAAGLMAWPGINPESLRKVCQENIAPRLVINQRKADIYRYSTISRQPWELGWRIETREAASTPSKSVRDDIRDAERFLQNCSRDFGYTEVRERDAAFLSPFSAFLAKTIEDLYTYDGWAIWTDVDRSGRVKSFTNLPAGNIRLAFPGQGYRNDPEKFAALIDETGTPITAFTRDELVWKVMNPRTNPDIMGYGWSFVEMGVRLIQAYQGAIDLNADQFNRNGIPNGMLLLMGDYWNQDQIDLLQREWQNMKKGQSKVWTVPVLAVPDDGDVKVLPLNDLKGTDVRFRDHMNMMGGAFCVVSGFPPGRLGLFSSGHSKDNEPIKGESTQLEGTDDVGLPRDLGFIAETVTEYLIAPNWPHLVMRFMNADQKAAAREYEQRKLSRTWRESRAETDQPKLTTGVPEELVPLMEVMELAPEDPNKAGVFQVLASIYLKSVYGDGTSGEEGSEGADKADEQAPTGRMRSKTDPAASEQHGHTAGVRRNSRAERQSAKQNKTETA